MRALAALATTLLVLAAVPPSAATPQAASYVGAAFTSGACADSDAVACFSVAGMPRVVVHVSDTAHGILRAAARDPSVPRGLAPVVDAEAACIQVALVGAPGPTLHGCDVVVISPLPASVTGLRVSFEPAGGPDGTCLCFGVSGSVFTTTF